MGVIYRHKINEFKALISEEYPLSSTLGKFEYEEIALIFIKEAVKKREWPELEVSPVEIAEKMADLGYLSRCRPPAKSPAWNDLEWLTIGTYQITNEALDIIIERRKNLAKKRKERR